MRQRMFKTALARMAIYAVVILVAVPGALLAGPKISFRTKGAGIGLVSKAEIGHTATSNLRITAIGPAAVSQVYADVGGVLFQGIAQPDNNVTGDAIDLSYSLKGDHDAVLRVRIGEREATSDVPAWVWVVAARFADSKYTAAITLLGKPETDDEVRYDNKKEKPVYWIRYHPAVDDTLIGFFLFSADSMFVNADIDLMRGITQDLAGLEGLVGYDVQFNEASSAKAAETIMKQIHHGGRPGGVLRWWWWTTYMLNDVETDYKFRAKGGRLEIQGNPTYHFGMVGDNKVFIENRYITEYFAGHPDTVQQLNPLVYEAVYDFGRMVSFFRYVKKANPHEFREFMTEIDPVLNRIPEIDTPAAWQLPVP